MIQNWPACCTYALRHLSASLVRAQHCIHRNNSTLEQEINYAVCTLDVLAHTYIKRCLCYCLSAQ